MELQFDVMKIILSILVACSLGIWVRLFNASVVKPKRIQEILRKQGISGPPSTLLLGNIREINKSQQHRILNTPTHEPPTSHNVVDTLFPFLGQWRKQFGELFVFSLGNIQILHMTEPYVVKEIITCTCLDFGKPSRQRKELGPLLGEGVLTSNGAAWASQRKILAPELYMEKIKGMNNLITESAIALLNSWKNMIETDDGVVDINIDDYLRKYSGDVISKACFGSNYSKGEQIFLKLRALQKTMSKKSLFMGIPLLRYLPTKGNRYIWRLEKEVRNLILKVVKEREETTYEKDLLQMVLEGAKSSNLSQEAVDRFIIDNCKNIYLAGYETTAVSAAWTLMLLASNQEWQERVRAEVQQVCRGRIPDVDMLHKMKQLTMVIHESLRLYPPTPVVSREAFEDMKFRNINIPKGVNIWMIVLALHTNPEVWGPDAYAFKPDRFANGIASACKFPYLYMPFGFGPRVCLGQNLAMVELKMLLAIILSNFSFSLSTKYVHSPALRFLIEPGHGVDLLIRKL